MTTKTAMSLMVLKCRRCNGFEGAFMLDACAAADVGNIVLVLKCELRTVCCGLHAHAVQV